MISFLRKIFSRRRPFRLTRGGWIFLLYTVGVGAGAINTGNNLLYLVFGLFLGIILASGVLSDLSLWNVSMNLTFPVESVAGDSNLVGLRVVNQKKRFPSLSVTVEIDGDLKGEPLILKKYIPVLVAGEALSTHLLFKPLNRGRFQVNRVRFATHFPFGLFYKWWTYRCEYQTLVHPKRLPVSAADLHLRSLGDESLSQSDRRGEGTTIHGIREFKESDSPRRIHWKASAKRHVQIETKESPWLVREMESDEKEDRYLIWPALSRFPAISPPEAENLIRFTASLVRLNRDQGKRSQLFIPEQDGPSSVVYQISEAPDHDLTHRLLDFLSVFDGRAPEAPLSQAYLVPVSPDVLAVGESPPLSVYDHYKSWEAAHR